MSSESLATRRAARVVCLLPARNAAEDLPGWLESVGRFADAVVALDDGSTDGTPELLAGDPLVHVLLRNPPRPDHGGWDDSGNRNRLLAAAATLAPDWIISLDADERIPGEDADALRRFIDERAVAGLAYGFPRYRMVGDEEHFDVCDSRVIRLFAFRPGQVLPPDRLHFVPVPTSIPPGRRLMTDVRIQHLGSLTQERRLARVRKYAEADPDRRWEDDDDYANVPPGELTRWRSRRPGQPVVLAPGSIGASGVQEAPAVALDGPVLSVILIVGEDQIEEMAGVFEAVQRQRCEQPVEALVLALGPEVADDLARLLPGAMVVALAPDCPPARSRNIGVGIARGDYVVCLDAPAALAPGALDALVREHDTGRAVVTLAVDNGTPSLPGWASYLDGPIHASFAREALLSLGGFAEPHGGRAEADAVQRLLAAGHRSGRCSLLVLSHRTGLPSAGAYLRERHAAGRRGLAGPWPAARLWRALRDDSPEVRRSSRRVAPLVLAGWAASLIGNVTRRRR